MKQIAKSVLMITLSVVVYKCLLQFVAAYLGYWLYTLILLITPVVLFMVAGRLQATVWKQYTPFLRIVFFCLSVSIAAGLCIGLVDYMVLKYRLTLFGTAILTELDSDFISFEMNYLSWYAIIGLVSGIVIWGIFYLQLRMRGKTTSLKDHHIR